jgi:hypothetical protein
VLPAPLQALQAHQGEELIFILPAVILLGTWLFVAWPTKRKPSDHSSEPHQEDPKTPRADIAEPPGGA